MSADTWNGCVRGKSHSWPDVRTLDTRCGCGLYSVEEWNATLELRQDGRTEDLQARDEAYFDDRQRDRQQRDQSRVALDDQTSAARGTATVADLDPTIHITSVGPASGDSAVVPGVSPNWRRRIDRFNYWNISELNPYAPNLTERAGAVGWIDGDPEWIGKQAHAHSDVTYRQRFDAGDVEAIFEYVRLDSWAFREHWVTAQSEAWAATNQEQYRRLQTCWMDGRGTATLDGLGEQIEKDLRVFRTISESLSCGEPLKAALLTAMQDHHVSLSSAKDVYYPYQALFDKEGLDIDGFMDALATIVSRLKTVIATAKSA